MASDAAGCHLCPRCGVELAARSPASNPARLVDTAARPELLDDPCPLGGEKAAGVDSFAQKQAKPIPLETSPLDISDATDDLVVEDSDEIAYEAILLADDLSDWELTKELSRVEKALGIDPSDPPEFGPEDHTPKYRFDAAHHTPPAGSADPKCEPSPSMTDDKSSARPLPRSLSIVLLTGLAGLTCGGSSLAIAFLRDNQTLWSLGMPIALVGAGMTLLGLVMQLDRLWQENRENVVRADVLSQQFRELDPSTSGTTHQVHPAEEVSPSLLLAELQRQVDRLAEQIRRDQA